MNIQALMQQAQTMQKKVEANVENAKKELANKEVQAEAGSGLVKVTMTGRHVVKRLTIDAVRQADELYEETMAGATSGMGLPPGMQGLF